MPDYPDTDNAPIHDGDAMMSHAEDAAHEAGKLNEKVTDAALESARRTAKATEEMANKGREHFAEGMRTLADAYAPLAQASDEARRRLVETSSRITDLYSEAANHSAEDVQALTSSYLQLGHGLLRLQKGYLNSVQQSLAEAKHHPQDLLNCKSVAEFAEVQRDFYLDGISFMVQSSTALMHMAGEIAQSAAGPLESRSHA